MSTVYNGIILEEITVDVSQPNDFAPKFVKQGDAYTRGFVATITQNGEKLDVPSTGTSVLFNCSNQTDKTKKDSQLGVVNADGTVTVIVPASVMDVEGYIYCDISLISADGNDTHILKTTLFVLSCEKAANKNATTSEAEDNILAGIIAGTIHIPGVTGWEPIIINSETVPESVNWNDEIPDTFAGSLADVALWEGQLWYLSNVVDYPQSRIFYYWTPIATVEDIATKMDLAPVNPSAEAISDMEIGQVYSDTTNHKGVIKTGTNTKQEFYDSTYVDEKLQNNYYTKTETNTLLGTKENTSNKVTSLSAQSTDTEYPSAKCVYDMIGNVGTALDTLNENLSEV